MAWNLLADGMTISACGGAWDDPDTDPAVLAAETCAKGTSPEVLTGVAKFYKYERVGRKPPKFVVVKEVEYEVPG